MLVYRLIFLGVALAYLALPGHPLALLPGLPLGRLGLAVGLAVVVWLSALAGPPPRPRLGIGVLAGLVLLKVALSWLAPPYGLVAEYRAGGPQGAFERSTDWPGIGATRVDSTLAFHGAEFPVHFFNDIHRFNFFTANEPRRDLLPFSVRWTGQLWAPTSGHYRLALESNGRAALSVADLVAPNAGNLVVESGNRVRQEMMEGELTAGLHPIEVRYARPEEGMPWLAVFANSGDAELTPLAAPLIVRDGAGPAGLSRDALVRPLAVVVDLAWLVTLLALFGAHARQAWRQPAPPTSALERPLLALFLAVALGADLLAHLHLVGQTVILSGGNDWLAYESFARDVLLDGPLLGTVGQGQPYYYQPLYVYWLALIHLILGEGLFGPLVMNAALGVAASLLVYLVARDLFGRLAAVVAMLLFAAYRVTVFAPTTDLLLSENLLVPLVPLLLFLLARAARTASWWAIVGAGVVLGLAGLARTTPLAVLPIALLALGLGFRRLGLSGPAAGSRLAVLVAVSLLTISPAAIRNYLVSGRLVPITSSVGANLWEMHRPSQRVDLSRIDRQLLYEQLQLDRQTREVLEFIRQDPAGYATTLAPMALYAIGFVGAPGGTADVQLGLLGVCLAYLLVTALVSSARRPATWPLHGFVWTHLAAVTLVFSNQYGFRLVLPMYAAMIPVVGQGIAVASGWAASGRGSAIRRRATAIQVRPADPKVALPLAIVALGSLVLLAGAPSEDRARESFYGLAGDAAIAARQAARADRLSLADDVYFVGEDSRSSAIAYLRGLAYPAMRWFDGSRGMVLPPPGERALYMLPDRAAPDFARGCLGDETRLARELDLPSGAWLDVALASLGDGDCTAPQHWLEATFEGTARLLGYDAPASLEPGQPMDAILRWQPLTRPQNRSRPFVRLLDGRGRAWGQAEAAVYPSSSWRPGETVLGTARLDVDPTLPPGEYRLEFGFSAGAGLARLANDGPAGLRAEARARGGVIRLVSRSMPLAPDALPITVAASGALGEVQLLGAALDRENPRPGDRARLTLFWQTSATRPTSQDVSLVLRDSSGGTVHEWRGAPVDGTYPTSAWKPGEIVRDTWDLVLPSSLPPGPLSLAVGLAPPGRLPERYLSLVSLALQAISRQYAEPAIRTRQEARFGDLARLVGYDLRNRRLKAGDSVEVSLIWQALAETRENYTVSVQLQGIDERVVAQHDGEPAAGRRPTASWLPDEFVEDLHRVKLPRDAPRGRYQLAVVLYRPDDGQRLLDPAGGERVVLGTDVVVE